MQDEIDKADPALRRRLILLLLIATAVGFVLIRAYPTFVNWALGDPDTAAARSIWIAASLLLLLLPVLLVARSVWRFGQASAENGRFPPQGQTVIRDTRVLRDAAAVRRGRLLQWLAVILSVLTLSLPLAMWLMIGALLGTL